MQASHPHYREVVEQGFLQAPFVPHLGIEFVDCGPGWCESVLPLKSQHLQQTGVAHAGVHTTIADHTAGGAAKTLIAADEYVLSVEFKMHLLRPGKGESLWCRAEVLKPGRQFHVIESQVFALEGARKTLVSKFIGTLAVFRHTES